MATLLRAITGELAATTQSWADVGASAQRYHTYPPACPDHRDVVDMPHRTTRSDHCKIFSFLLKLKTRLSTIAQQVFAVPDADARRHSWQITITHGGFGRRYRDPRFDYLAPCTACSGRGGNPRGITCPACGGTGRIVLDSAAVSRPRRGQP